MTAYGAVKRIIDFLVSLIALIILAIPLAIIIIALRFSGEGEVFYKQVRVGYLNRDFGIWKFATMLKNSPNMGTGSLTVRGDPRVTSVGRVLRATKINELPQLINVLTGEMSFVGPRPQMKVDFDIYPERVRDTIYSVPPGVTGIGSIVFRDEELLLSAPGVDPRKFYEEKIAPYKGELEMWYLAHKSLTTDLRLMFLTVWVVFRPESTIAFRTFPDLPPRPTWLHTRD